MATTATTTTTTTEKKEKMVKIRLPIIRGDNNADVFVGVNGRTWLIKRGVEVEVPECCAVELRQQEEALMKAYERQQSMAN
jgi:exosome complex RNA-binding protein Rrp4